MFPLTIKDFPVSVQDSLQDFIVALDLVPFKLTCDYDSSIYWNIYCDPEVWPQFAQGDRSGVCRDLLPSREFRADSSLLSKDKLLVPEKVRKPFVFFGEYQFVIPFNFDD